MTFELSDVRGIRSEFGRWLRTREAVRLVGIGVGYKSTLGAVSQDSCIQVFVGAKQSKRVLGRLAAIPAFVDGVPTDVRTSKMTSFMAEGARPNKTDIALALKNAQYRERKRPLTPGISCANRYVPAGTLGHFCRRTDSASDEVYILSSGHVLRGKSREKSSASILQASPSDGGILSDTVAVLATSSRLRGEDDFVNTIDAGIAKLVKGIDYSTTIPNVGRLRGREIAYLGMRVSKVGRSTGITHGEVTAIDYETVIPWGWREVSEYYRFGDQLRVEPIRKQEPFGQSGDSGATVFSSTGLEAVGLYFAGAPDGSYGLCTPIHSVEREMDIQILV